MIENNNNIREHEKIAREIEKTSESIRKKHRALKTSKIEDNIAMKTRFKPIIEPRQKIVDNSNVRAIKGESELPDDDVKTLSVQKRKEDAELNMKKRSNTSLDRKSKHLDAPGLDASPITSTPSTTSVQPTMSESLANEDVFETTGDLFAESVQNQLQTGSNRQESQKTLRETLREHLGPLSQKYVRAILIGDRESDMDCTYSVYLDKDVRQ